MKVSGQLDERNLIVALKNGSEKSIGQLYHIYVSKLYKYVYGYMKSEDVTKDIVQEIFIRIWEKRIKFENELLLRKYLYLSTQNKCFTYLRDRKVQHYHKQQIIDNYQEQEEPNIINSLIKEEVYRQLLSSIEQLPPQCKKICLLTLDGKKPSEIAKELELNVETVKKQKKIALKRLQDKFRILILLFSIT